MRGLIGICLALTVVVAAARGEAVAASDAGGSCAGTAGLGCNSGLWCQQQAGRCGYADAEGQCVRVPQVCTQVYSPVCGCNGRTYGNDCERMRAKVNKAHDGACGARDRTTRSPRVEPDATRGQ